MTPRSLFLSAALALTAALSWGCDGTTSPDADLAPDAPPPALQTTATEQASVEGDATAAPPDEPGAPEEDASTLSDNPNCAWTPWQNTNDVWCSDAYGCPTRQRTNRWRIRYYLCADGFKHTQFSSVIVGCGCSGATD